MTQKADIFSFLLKNSPKRFTQQQISKFLKINPNSTRGRLSNLFKARKIKKTHRRSFIFKRKQVKYYVPKGKMKKYILNTVMYCSSKPKTMKATTFSDRKFDRIDIMNLMNSMIEKITEETINDCSEIAYDSGLDITDVKSMPFEFPEIRTGILIQISKVALENFS